MNNLAAAEIHIIPHAEPVFEVAGVQITNSMLLGWVVSILLIAGMALAASRVKLKSGGRTVTLVELAVESVINLMEQIMRDRGKAIKYTPFLITLFLFIMFNNWAGLLPGVGTISYGGVHLFRAWTSDLTGTLAIAVTSIVIIMIYSFRELKVGGVLKHYFSNQPWNPINLFVGLLEILGEFTRIASLSLRLFGNIFAGEVLLLVIASIASFGSPVATLPFFLMELFVGFIQAFVFTTLVIVYLTLATSHHDGEHEEAPSHSVVTNSAASKLTAQGSPE